MNNKPFKSIYISYIGDVSIRNISYNDLNDYELGCLDNKCNYPLSVAVKLFSKYGENESIFSNNLANYIFQREDMSGSIYILLDPYDDEKKFNKIFLKVYDNIKKGIIMGRNDEEKKILHKKMKKALDDIFRTIKI